MKRYELKFYLTLQEATYLSKKLEKVLRTDENVKSDKKKNGYHISSLYFDSINTESSWEKLGGFKKREKFRIRIYDPPWNSGDIIKFEIKRKFADLIEKETVSLNLEDTKALIKGNTYPFYKSINKKSDNYPIKYPMLFALSYSKFRTGYYKPYILIDYFRKAFFAKVNNLRVTLDYNISSSEDFKNFLQCYKQRRSHAILNQYCILEIKFYHFFPNQYKFLFEHLNCVRSAVSKYVMGLASSNVDSDNYSYRSINNSFINII